MGFALTSIYTVTLDGEDLGYIQILLAADLPPWVALTADGDMRRFYAFEDAEAFIIRGRPRS
jgi:hypothetical protein